MARNVVKVALLGACGWMGKCHSLGYRNLPLLYPEDQTDVVISWIVDADADRLARIAPAYPGARVSTDWLDVLADETVDLVDICLPDEMHFPVAKAALSAGKHVYCEKPFTANAAEADELATLAERSGLITRVGHNFPINPVHEITRDLISSGKIGEVVLFRASMHVDVLADPDTPFMWRCDGQIAPTGVVGDVASHLFSFLNMLLGPVTSLVADVATTTKFRPVVEGFNYGKGTDRRLHNEQREVTNSDLVTLLCNFEGGGRGVIDVSRVASGRRFRQAYEIYGTKGGIAFDYDEVNRLRVYSSEDPAEAQGYRSIDVGPERANYAAFLPVANFGLGYNEFKAIEVCDVVRSVVRGNASWPSFRDGHQIMKVVDACFRSSKERGWVEVG